MERKRATRVPTALFNLILADRNVDWQRLGGMDFEAKFQERLVFLRNAIRMAQLNYPDESETLYVALRHGVSMAVVKIVLMAERFDSSLSRVERLSFLSQILNVLSRNVDNLLP